MTLEFITVPVTSLQQNCTLIVHPSTQSAVIVDPGGDADQIWAHLKRQNLTLEQIWLTHSHLDHCGGVKGLMRSLGSEGKEIPFVGHAVEQMFRERVEDICRGYGIPAGEMENCPEPNRYIIGGEVLEFQGEEFEVRFCPGHSPGHCVFYWKNGGVLLAGDTLFAGSIGRTDLPGGDHQQLLDSIRREIYTLPPETEVLPGHGPRTTVGEEESSNPLVRSVA
ncbi:MAG: MBL fold metallo-hydrolase [Bdellovibrionales bacterium]|nr:MBL fold metallo-hydrolase [Bdellovibrionales bacterium]